LGFAVEGVREAVRFEVRVEERERLVFGVRAEERARDEPLAPLAPRGRVAEAPCCVLRVAMGAVVL
jgi:hypothetical protein